ncbi:NADH-quinone oxidoreductase subunit A [Mucilaginibacter koreensis]
MSEVSQISEFGKIFIFLITGFILVGVTMFMARLISPNNPTPEKLTTYECGEEPEGSAWLPFNTRFYVIALVFLLFDVEMVFIFPWATVFADKTIIAQEPRWGTFSLIEMFAFVTILILGLVYVWRKGDLEWIKPVAKVAKTDVKIPLSVYEQLNAEQSVYAVRLFSTTTTPPEAASAATTAEIAANPAAAKKPMFKPAFKKPAP